MVPKNMTREIKFFKVTSPDVTKYGYKGIHTSPRRFNFSVKPNPASERELLRSEDKTGDKTGGAIMVRRFPFTHAVSKICSLSHRSYIPQCNHLVRSIVVTA